MSVPSEAATVNSQSSDSERLAAFADRVIGHRNLLAVRDGFLSRVAMPANVQIAFLYGPTGVGKTTLISAVERDVRRRYRSAAEQDPDLVPVVAVRAAPAEAGPFGWSDLYLRIMLGLAEPHVERRIVRSPVQEEARRGHGRGRSTAELRRFAIGSLRQHKTAALLIDEAQHMGRVASGRGFLAQLDVLKSLADETGALVGLIGTYDLPSLIELNGQLARRSEMFHLGRYGPNDDADRQEFANIVAALARYLPLPQSSELMDRLGFLYEGSLGLVGVLKPWLDRALARALERKAGSLSEADLQATRLGSNARLRIAEEIHAYESTLPGEDDSSARIRALLGVTPPTKGGVPGPMHERPRRFTAVGERKPVRDPVGIAASA